MAKLFIFGIGGTGSRVIKAMTMLLASGVKLSSEFDTVVPIIIDPDTANGDLNLTADILIKYQNIFEKVGARNNFFGTKISTLSQLTNSSKSNIADNFKFQVSGSGQKFGESIDYNGLDTDTNQAFVDLLFSQENIESDMTVGFKGNPNIGSVVLNKFIDTEEYRAFTNSFNKGDSIFIISSIFGGTGASGFPLLLKNLRNSTSSIPNSDIISKSTIGAISYLPYFKITDNGDENNAIDSSTFLGKAKAALNYYEHAIFSNNKLDAFYYLGDQSNNHIPYAEGEEAQKNNAHFLELAGALSIFDFAKNQSQLLDTSSTITKEFGIEEGESNLRFKNLGAASKDLIIAPLSKLMLLQKFLKKSMGYLRSTKGGFYNGASGVNEKFYNSDFFKMEFSKFLAYFENWTVEMDDNVVSFAPWHDNQEHDSLLNFIKGNDVKNSLFSKKASADNILKKAEGIVKSNKYNTENVESRFLKIFDEVLEEEVNQILN